MHLFTALMIATFVAAVIVLLGGVTGMGKTDNGKRSTKFMALRVALCILLLVEILVYVFIFKHPA